MNPKNKKVLIVALSGIALMIVGIIAIMLYNPKNNKPKQKKPQTEIQIVEEESEVLIKKAVNYSKSILINDTEITIKDSDNDVIIDKKKNKQYLNDSDNLFIVSEKKSIELNKNGENNETELKTEVVVDLYNSNGKKSGYVFGNVVYDDIKGVSFDNKHIYIVETNKGDIKNKITITKYLESNTIGHVNKATINKVDMKNILVIDDSLIYSVDNQIYRLNLETLQKEELNLGGEIKSMYLIDDKIFILNDFGKGKDNSVLFKIDVDSFKVEKAIQTKDKDYQIKGLDFINNKIIFDNNVSKSLKENNDTQKSPRILELNLEDDALNLIDTPEEFEVFEEYYKELTNSKTFIIR